MVGRNLPVRARQGGKVVKTGTYRAYVCGSYFAHGKSACLYNRLPEAPLLAAIARKLKERFSPAFLDAFRRCALDELRSLGGADRQSEADEARARIAELEGLLDDAAEQLLREKDERVLARCRARLIAWDEEQKEMAARLKALETQEEDRPEDPDAIADACVRALEDFEDVLAKGSPAEVRAVLRDHVSHVELWFRHEQKGRETHCHFARGLVFIREDSPLASCLGTVETSSSRSTAWS
jgi:hypothetical protein